MNQTEKTNTKQEKPVNRIEKSIETLVFASRWLQAPIYVGILLILFPFIYFVFKDIYTIFTHLNQIDDETLIISALTLCDIGLIANLIIIVVVSGYENFVSKLDIEHAKSEPIWIKRLKYGDVKMKIIASIVAISSIQLLKLLLMKNSSREEMMFAIVIQLVFVVSALFLALIGRLEKSVNKNAYTDHDAT